MIIFRYITKEIVATILAATLVLLVIFITNQSLQFLQRAALGQLPATQIFHVILLQVPLLVPYLLPLALYLGILLTLGRMHLELEMTVLHACGVSRAKITGMVMVVAVGVAVLVGWLMGVVVPRAQGELNNIVDRAAVTASVDQVIPGRFVEIHRKKGSPIVFYAKRVENHQVLHDVFMAQREKSTSNAKQEKWGVIIAKTALEEKVPEQEGNFLIFNEGRRYSGIPGDEDYHVLKFKQYGVRLTVNPMPKIDAVQNYSFSKLWHVQKNNRAAAAEFQWRLAMPISAVVFALLAVPLSEVRPRLGKFTQLLPAILIYMCYADLIFLSRSWIRTGKISPELGMWWVHGSALLLAICLILYRVGWHRIHLFFSRKINA